MEKDYFIKVTLALYKVTELFSLNEPLRFSLREKAIDILTDSILLFSKNPLNLNKEQKKSCSEELSKNIELLQSYFEIAGKQDWVRKENFLVLKKEYGKLKEEIDRGFQEKEVPKIEPQEKKLENNFGDLKKGRYGEILKILREKKTAQVKDLKEIFPQISKRTLRRDFDYLLRKGMVERIGDKSRTLYKLREF